jgi:hypothetical protein
MWLIKNTLFSKYNSLLTPIYTIQAISSTIPYWHPSTPYRLPAVQFLTDTHLHHTGYQQYNSLLTLIYTIQATSSTIPYWHPSTPYRLPAAHKQPPDITQSTRCDFISHLHVYGQHKIRAVPSNMISVKQVHRRNKQDHNIKNATPHYLHILRLERTLVPLNMKATGRSKTPVLIHKSIRCHVAMLTDYPRPSHPQFPHKETPPPSLAGIFTSPTQHNEDKFLHSLPMRWQKCLSRPVGGGEVVRTECQAEQWESVLTDGEVWTGASCEDLGWWAECRHILQLHFWGIRMM